MSDQSIHALLDAYAFERSKYRIEEVPPGFSGARVWRLEGPLGAFALRRWPAEHPTVERLSMMHRLLEHLRVVGYSLLPLPVAARTGQTFVEYHGRLWEITTWMPGAADFAKHPTSVRLQAACRALAEFHRAAKFFAQGILGKAGGSAVLLLPGGQIKRLLAGDAKRLSDAIEPRDWPELAERGRRIIELFNRAADGVSRRLKPAARRSTPFQMVLRDIKSDHVLFEQDRVSGIVNFGAMRVGCVSGDIARLLGSMAADDADRWNEGLAAYESVRPLSPAERKMISHFDESAVLLSGIHWLQWIYLEQRVFENRSAVIARLDELIPRMERLASRS